MLPAIVSNARGHLVAPALSVRTAVRASMRAFKKVTKADFCVVVWPANQKPTRWRFLCSVADQETAAVLSAQLAGVVMGDVPAALSDQDLVVEQVCASSEVIGYLVLGRRSTSTLPEGYSGALAAQLGAMLEGPDADLSAMSDYQSLLDISTKIQTETRVSEVFDLIVKQAKELLETDIAWIGVVENGWVKITHHRGASAEFARMKIEVTRSITGAALQQRTTVIAKNFMDYVKDAPSLVRGTLNAEHVVSMACAPLIDGERMVGALYVGNRHATDFTEADAMLLTALAAQGCAALVNVDSLRRLAEQRDVLEVSVSIHREISTAVLDGESVEGISKVVSKLLEAPVSVYAAGQFRDGDPGLGTPCVDVPILARGQKLGTLVIDGVADLNQYQSKVVEHAIPAFAVELLKIVAADEVEWRLRGELLSEIIDAGDTVGDALRERCARLEINLEREFRVVVIASRDGLEGSPAQSLLPLVTRVAYRTWSGAVGNRPLTACRDGVVIIALDDLDGTIARRLLDSLEADLGRLGIRWVSGISERSSTTSAAMRNAAACLALARHSLSDLRIVWMEDLGPLRFMLDAPDLSQCRATVMAQLGALIRHDDVEATKGLLLPTLRAYLEAGGHQGSTAAALFVHVSTVKYRLQKINAILDRSISQSDCRFELRLAIRMLDILVALGYSESPD